MRCFPDLLHRLPGHRLTARRWLMAMMLCLAALGASCQPAASGRQATATPSRPQTVTPSRRQAQSLNTTATPASAQPAPDSDPTAVAWGAQIWALQACQACHGALAQGAEGPALRSPQMSLADFLARVRQGGEGMRGYSSEEVDDRQLEALYAWLRSLPAAAPTPLPNDLGLHVPPRVRVTRFAGNLSHPAALAFDPAGDLYVAAHGPSPAGSAATGEVWRITDQDGDGQADLRTLVAGGLQRPMALLWLRTAELPATLLVGGQGGLFAVTKAGAVRHLLGELPGVSDLQVNGMALGTDGLLYLSQSAPPGAAGGTQPAAVWRMDPAALLAGQATPERFVTGLRSPAGIAFSPSGAIYLVDSGLDQPFRPDVPDELNLLLGGADYGWPAFWGQPPADSGTIGPMVEFPPGSGASGLIYLHGRLFTEYANDQLVALAGQQSGSAAAAVVRVEIVSDVTGYHGYVHEFIAGLQRPMGLAEGPDGAIYVADYQAGAVYRLGR